ESVGYGCRNGGLKASHWLKHAVVVILELSLFAWKAFRRWSPLSHPRFSLRLSVSAVKQSVGEKEPSSSDRGYRSPQGFHTSCIDGQDALSFFLRGEEALGGNGFPGVFHLLHQVLYFVLDSNRFPIHCDVNGRGMAK